MAKIKIVKINLLQTAMTLGTWLGLYQILKLVSMPLSLKYGSLGLLFFLLAIGVPFVAWKLIKKFRDETTPEFFPFSSAFLICLLMFVFATMLSGFAAYIYLHFIDKGWFFTELETQFTAAKDLLIASGMQGTDAAQFDASQFDAATEMLQSMTDIGATKQLLSTAMFWGNIFSLIIAGVTARYGGIRKAMKEGASVEEIMERFEEEPEENNDKQ